MMTPEKKGISPGKDRPGIETIQEIGHEWEEEQFHQLIEAISEPEKIAYSYDKKNHFEEVPLIKILKSKHVPELLIEASFEFLNIFNNLNYEIFEFDGARPDIIWITEGENGKNVLNIIDIKTAAEPSLKHFSEVVLYALSLNKLIHKEKLNDRYVVNMDIGYIWPGTHDVDFFIKNFNAHQARASTSPLKDALEDILVPIKLELYYEHVLDFFEDRVPKTYALEYEEAQWFFNKGCNLCDYRDECSEECDDLNLIYQVPDITRGQAETLLNAGIQTLEQMLSDENGWTRAIVNNITLKPVKQILQTKAKAITENQVFKIPDKKTYLMPNWTDISIYIEIHFDPITGLTYGIGAKTKIWSPEERTFISPDPEVLINDKAGTGEKIFENSSEKAIFIDFLKYINRVISLAIEQGQSIHFYFWDSLELKQLKRMMTRYFKNESILSELEKLMQFYAPEGYLENPDIFETIPGTIVKNSLSYILALPLKFDYSLIQSANVILRTQNKEFQYLIHKHFYTEMNDQIPFERAYDLWTNQVRIYDPKTKAKYTREKVRERLKSTIIKRLQALQTIVDYMQMNQGEQLLLQKKPLQKVQPTKKQGMDPLTNELYIFERLNHISRDIENKQQRLLPVDEKEARFISMRGLILLDKSYYLDEIKEVMALTQNIDSKISDYYVFSIPQTSLDVKINEGAFLLVLTNEVDPSDQNKPQINSDMSVGHHLQMNFYDVLSAVEGFGLKNTSNIARLSLKSFLQVTLVKLSAASEQPFIIVKANNFYGNTIEFAFKYNLLNASLPFVVDPVYKDFNLKDYEKILKLIGKKPITKSKSMRKK
jgi:predicted RecB family nuclease